MKGMWRWLMCLCTVAAIAATGALADPVCTQYDIDGTDCRVINCEWTESSPWSVTVDCREGLFEELGFQDRQILINEDGEDPTLTTGAGYPGPFAVEALPYAPIGPVDEEGSCYRRSRNFGECAECALDMVEYVDQEEYEYQQERCVAYCSTNGDAHGCNSHGCSVISGCGGGSGCNQFSVNFPTCCIEDPDCNTPPYTGCPGDCLSPGALPCQPWPSCWACMENPTGPNCLGGPPPDECTDFCYTWCEDFPDCE